MSLLLIDLIDRRGHSVQAEIALRRDTVEIRFAEVLVGIADRDWPRAWLHHPEGTYGYDDVTWFAHDGEVGLEIHGLVPASYLTHRDLNNMREQV